MRIEYRLGVVPKISYVCQSFDMLVPDVLVVINSSKSDSLAAHLLMSSNTRKS